MNKKLKYILAVIVIIFISALGSGMYYIYDKIITFPDNNEERIIRNVMSDHKAIVDRKSALNSNFNDAIESFGGVKKISKENNIIELKTDNTRLEEYAFNYYLRYGEYVSDKDKFYSDISSNYKYYNEEQLELYLIIFNYDCNDDLTVEDIKSYVDNGNHAKQEDILKYINWYFEYGKNEYAGYADYFSGIILLENEEREYRKKYGRVTFYSLTLDQQKEIINQFNEMGVLEKVKYKNNFY